MYVARYRMDFVYSITYTCTYGTAQLLGNMWLVRHTLAMHEFLENSAAVWVSTCTDK